MRGARQRRRSPSSFRTSAPSPRWGWHRLEPAAARRVVEQAAIRRGELVVDLGAGSGVLTDALLAAGARVIAVELHPDRVATLRTRYDGRPVDVIRADVARVRLPTRPFRVVANPPWSVAESIRESLT